MDLGGWLQEYNLKVFRKAERMGARDKACQSHVCHARVPSPSLMKSLQSHNVQHSPHSQLVCVKFRVLGVKTRTQYVAQAGLESVVPLPQPPECRDYRVYQPVQLCFKV